MRQQRINGDTASLGMEKSRPWNRISGVPNILAQHGFPEVVFQKKKETDIYITSRKNPTPEFFSREIILPQKIPEVPWHSFG